MTGSVVFVLFVVGTFALGGAFVWLQYHLEQQHVRAYEAFCASS